MADCTRARSIRVSPVPAIPITQPGRQFVNSPRRPHSGSATRPATSTTDAHRRFGAGRHGGTVGCGLAAPSACSVGSCETCSNVAAERSHQHSALPPPPCRWSRRPPAAMTTRGRKRRHPDPAVTSTHPGRALAPSSCASPQAVAASRAVSISPSLILLRSRPTTPQRPCDREQDKPVPHRDRRKPPAPPPPTIPPPRRRPPRRSDPRVHQLSGARLTELSAIQNDNNRTVAVGPARPAVA